jgi:bifunctional non-homologous end joining protein LigD
MKTVQAHRRSVLGLLRDCPTEPLPRHIEPMKGLAAATIPPNESEYGFEYKWDGVRAILYADPHAPADRRVLIESRNLLDVTGQYPELGGIAKAIGRRAAVLDGEIVAVGDDSRPSFERLQRRMHVTNRTAIARLVEQVPVTLLLFDVLHLDGRSTRGLAYPQRREILESLGLADPHWQVPPWQAGAGSAMLRVAREQRLEGVMAKRLDSLYEPGRRSGAWLKIKLQRRQEFVIGGFTPGKGQLAGSLGAILVGVYDLRAEQARRLHKPQTLHYAGSVGTGFTARSAEEILSTLRALRIDKSPFVEGRVRPEATWVRPTLLAEVEFTEWTAAGILRHPSFKAVRTDKDPKDVVRETN